MQGAIWCLVPTTKKGTKFILGIGASYQIRRRKKKHQADLFFILFPERYSFIYNFRNGNKYI
jgi:hypothetical protein